MDSDAVHEEPLDIVFSDDEEEDEAVRLQKAKLFTVAGDDGTWTEIGVGLVRITGVQLPSSSPTSSTKLATTTTLEKEKQEGDTSDKDDTTTTRTATKSESLSSPEDTTIATSPPSASLKEEGGEESSGTAAASSIGTAEPVSTSSDLPTSIAPSTTTGAEVEKSEKVSSSSSSSDDDDSDDDDDDHAARLEVLSVDDDGEVLLSTPLVVDDIYMVQHDSILQWTDPEIGRDMALSFNTTEGLHAALALIREFQRQNRSTSRSLSLRQDGTEEDSGGDGGGGSPRSPASAEREGTDVGSSSSSSTPLSPNKEQQRNNPNSDAAARTGTPATSSSIRRDLSNTSNSSDDWVSPWQVTRENLPVINLALHNNQKLIGLHIRTNDTFFFRLAQLFQECHDQRDLVGKARIGRITLSLLSPPFSTEGKILSQCVDSDIIETTIDMVQYGLGRTSAERGFLTRDARRARFRDPCGLPTPTISKIHTLNALQFLKDLLPLSLEEGESVNSIFASFVLRFKYSLIGEVLRDRAALPNLFQDSDAACHTNFDAMASLVDFLFDASRTIRNMAIPLDHREEMFQILLNHHILSYLKHVMVTIVENLRLHDATVSETLIKSIAIYKSPSSASPSSATNVTSSSPTGPGCSSSGGASTSPVCLSDDAQGPTANSQETRSSSTVSSTTSLLMRAEAEGETSTTEDLSSGMMTTEPTLVVLPSTATTTAAEVSPAAVPSSSSSSLPRAPSQPPQAPVAATPRPQEGGSSPSVASSSSAGGSPSPLVLPLSASTFFTNAKQLQQSTSVLQQCGDIIAHLTTLVPTVREQIQRDAVAAGGSFSVLWAAGHASSSSSSTSPVTAAEDHTRSTTTFATAAAAAAGTTAPSSQWWSTRLSSDQFSLLDIIGLSLVVSGAKGNSAACQALTDTVIGLGVGLVQSTMMSAPQMERRADLLRAMLQGSPTNPITRADLLAALRASASSVPLPQWPRRALRRSVLFLLLRQIGSLHALSTPHEYSNAITAGKLVAALLKDPVLKTTSMMPALVRLTGCFMGAKDALGRLVQPSDGEMLSLRRPLTDLASTVLTLVASLLETGRSVYFALLHKSGLAQQCVEVYLWSLRGARVGGRGTTSLLTTCGAHFLNALHVAMHALKSNAAGHPRSPARSPFMHSLGRTSNSNSIDAEPYDDLALADESSFAMDSSSSSSAASSGEKQGIEVLSPSRRSNTPNNAAAAGASPAAGGASTVTPVTDRAASEAVPATPAASCSSASTEDSATALLTHLIQTYANAFEQSGPQSRTLLEKLRKALGETPEEAVQHDEEEANSSNASNVVMMSDSDFRALVAEYGPDAPSPEAMLDDAVRDAMRRCSVSPPPPVETSSSSTVSLDDEDSTGRYLQAAEDDDDDASSGFSSSSSSSSSSRSSSPSSTDSDDDDSAATKQEETKPRTSRKRSRTNHSPVSPGSSSSCSTNSGNSALNESAGSTEEEESTPRSPPPPPLLQRKRTVPRLDAAVASSSEEGESPRPPSPEDGSPLDDDERPRKQAKTE